jgi:hypothetical protein
MSDNFKFPTDTCVLVCSGPSLNLVDPHSLGLPVVAISTAIRKITNPHYWILADYLNEMHGEEGNIAYQNENIMKIIPSGKINPKHTGVIRNYQEIQYSDSDRQISDIHAHLFSKKLPLLKGPHKSVTFAIQWLHHVGVKNVIWIGNDLNAVSADKKYAYESTMTDLRKAHNYNATLDQVHRSLKDWYPKAKQLGYTWFSWKCGDVFEQFVEKFDVESFELPNPERFYPPSEKSQYPVNSFPQVQRVVPQRISKEERRKLRDFRKQNVLNVQDKKKVIKNKLAVQPPKETKIVKKEQAKIQNLPKTPVNGKKYPAYVRIPNAVNADILNKKIRDSLR